MGLLLPWLMQLDCLQQRLEALDLCEAYATRVTPVELLLVGPQSLLPLVGDSPMKHPIGALAEEGLHHLQHGHGDQCLQQRWDQLLESLQLHEPL